MKSERNLPVKSIRKKNLVVQVCKAIWLKSMMKNAEQFCDKCIYKIYNRLRLPGVAIHFVYKNTESPNVIETLFNQIYE